MSTKYTRFVFFGQRSIEIICNYQVLNISKRSLQADKSRLKRKDGIFCCTSHKIPLEDNLFLPHNSYYVVLMLSLMEQSNPTVLSFPEISSVYPRYKSSSLQDCCVPEHPLMRQGYLWPYKKSAQRDGADCVGILSLA